MQLMMQLVMQSSDLSADIEAAKTLNLASNNFKIVELDE
jgi:hypothetical protein